MIDRAGAGAAEDDEMVEVAEVELAGVDVAGEKEGAAERITRATDDELIAADTVAEAERATPGTRPGPDTAWRLTAEGNARDVGR